MSSTIVSNVAARHSAPKATSLRVWQRISFAIAHAGVRLLMVCLSLKGLYRFGRMFGSIEYLINYKRRRRFHRMLQPVLADAVSPAERRRFACEFFRQRRCDKLFYLVFDCIPKDTARSLLSIGNRPILDDAVARGRGVQVATAHHGPVHVMGLLLSVNGYKVAGVREPHEGAMRKYVQERFDRLYPEFRQVRILSSESFPRDILRTLKEGYLIGSSMDVAGVDDPNKKTEEVTIFGQRRRFLSGPLWIALRCGAPVVQVFILPGKDFRYRLEVVGQLLDPDAAPDRDRAVRDAMTLYAANIERYVRETPHLISRI